jgi:hypothetical protein
MNILPPLGGRVSRRIASAKGHLRVFLKFYPPAVR